MKTEIYVLSGFVFMCITCDAVIISECERSTNRRNYIVDFIELGPKKSHSHKIDCRDHVSQEHWLGSWK